MHNYFHPETNVNFNVNGDFSGEVHIDLPVDVADMELLNYPEHGARVRVNVPYEALEYLVSMKYYRENIIQAEQEDPIDVMRNEMTVDPYDVFIGWIQSLEYDIETRRTVTLDDIIRKSKRIEIDG